MKLLIILNLIAFFHIYHRGIAESMVQELSQEEVISTISLSQCLVKVAELFFTVDSRIFAITASLEGHTDIVFQLFQLEGYWSFQVAHLNITNNLFTDITKENNYLIYIKHPYELFPVLKSLKNAMSKNYRPKLMIVSSTVFKNPQVVASDLIALLEQEGVTKALVFLAEENNSTRYAIHYWYSYSKLTYNHTELPINYCSFGVLKNYNTRAQEVISKCRTNCEIKVYYTAHPPYVINAEMGFQSSNYFFSQGFEINLLNMIVGHLNLTVKYFHSGDFWGEVYENGTITGDFRLLLNKSADVLIGSYTKTELRETYFELSLTYVNEYMVWCVSYMPIFQFKSIVDIFTVKIWILVILVYVLVSACVWTLSLSTKNESDQYKSLIFVLFNDFSVLLSISLNLRPRTLRVRYIMVLFFLFTIMVSSAYTSYLTSILSTPRYQQKYSSMGDIYKHNLTTYMMPNSISRFTDDFDSVNDVPVSLIRRKWISCYNLSECLEKVSRSETDAVCIMKLYKDYLMTIREIPVYCMNQNIVIFYVNMVMRKGFPHGQVFNIITNRIISSGFLSKWMQDLLNQKPKWDNFQADNCRITFTQLKPFFKIYVVCIFCAFIVFLCELFISK